MGTAKSKTGLGMIEAYIAPTGRIMTDHAVVFRIVFDADDSFMNVLMTIITPDPDLPETPFLLFLMAGKAGCRKMCPLQLEIPCIMLFNGKYSSRKPFGCMAAGTVGYNSLFCKLPVMIICVAVKATVMPHRVCDIVLVASFAGNTLVLVLQREFCFGMVKTADPPDRVE